MADSTAEFFDELRQRGHEPLLEKATATVRFDLLRGKQTDRWFVTIKQGDIAVSRRSAKADCTIRTRRTMFDRMARGEENLMAATLRGDIAVEGNVTLLVLFRRLFPGPPASRRRRTKTARRKK